MRVRIRQEQQRCKKEKNRTINEFYAEHYGERWPRLRAALSLIPRKVALYNRYCQVSVDDALPSLIEINATTNGTQEITENTTVNIYSAIPQTSEQSCIVQHNKNNTCSEHSIINNIDMKKLRVFGIQKDVLEVQEQASRKNKLDSCNDVERAETHDNMQELEESQEEQRNNGVTLIPQPLTDAFNVKSHYILDLASVMVVKQLDIGAFDNVLDLCAAPGGKSIAIAQLLSPSATLTCNEVKSDRVNRLRRTLKDYLPFNFVQWKLTQRDGCKWYDPNKFSRVLVDAPCSSERHLILQADGDVERISLREWSEQSSAKLAHSVQTELLLRAIETCKRDGIVVYSTCSLSPYENDGVITTVLSKTKCRVSVLSHNTHLKCKVHEMEMGESTLHGTIILPDVANGWGPMYYCVLRKCGDFRNRNSCNSSDNSSSSSSNNEEDDDDKSNDSISEDNI